MEIPVSFQLPILQPISGISLASKGKLPIFGKLPLEAKGIPDIGTGISISLYSFVPIDIYSVQAWCTLGAISAFLPTGIP